jgi:hypothetical protein
MMGHVFGRLQDVYLPNVIVWANDHDGNLMEPAYIWDKYYVRDVEIVRQEFMKDMDKFVDRHKIIALTQRIVLDIQPLTFKEREKFSDDDVFILNADYAFLFGIQYLCRCNEVFYPAKHFENPGNQFPTKIFTFPLYKTARGRAFIREHKKLLRAKSLIPIPLFWSSHLWYALEQWGLDYMRYQPGVPREIPESMDERASL